MLDNGLHTTFKNLMQQLFFALARNQRMAHHVHELIGMLCCLRNGVQALPDGVHVAFVGMTVAMIVLVALGVIYPRARRVHVPTAADAATDRVATEPEGSVQ